MASYTFRLPFPPSVNAVANKRYVDPAVKRYRAAVAEALAAEFGDAIPTANRCRIALELTAPSNRKADADNFLKVPIDAMKRAGLLAEDDWDHVAEVRATWTGLVDPPGACDVTLTEVE